MKAIMCCVADFKGVSFTSYSKSQKQCCRNGQRQHLPIHHRQQQNIQQQKHCKHCHHHYHPLYQYHHYDADIDTKRNLKTTSTHWTNCNRKIIATTSTASTIKQFSTCYYHRAWLCRKHVITFTIYFLLYYCTGRLFAVSASPTVVSLVNLEQSTSSVVSSATVSSVSSTSNNCSAVRHIFLKNGFVYNEAPVLKVWNGK